jgi:cytoskeletal protein CcmA (bactofilin family)
MAWGSKTGESGTGSGPVSSNALSFVGREVSIHGNVSGQGDLHIDGAVEGDIDCSVLIIGASGRIKGNVIAKRATIAGMIDGTVTAETLIVEKTATVTGDLSYNSVSIETGAQVDGRLTQRNPGQLGELKLVANQAAE